MQAIIKKLNQDKQEFFATAYRANAPADAQGDVMDADALSLATMRFAQAPRINIEHGNETLPAGVVRVLGTFMTGGKATGGYPANAWIIHGRCNRSEIGKLIWQRIKAGKAGQRYIVVDGTQYPALSGFSFEGTGQRVEVA